MRRSKCVFYGVQLFFVVCLFAAWAHAAAFEHVTVLAGRSELLAFDGDITRASISDTAIADVVVVSPQEILVNAKASGSTSLVVWFKDSPRRQYDISVGIDITRLKNVLQALAPDEDITVTTKDETVVLQGVVEKHHTIEYVNKVAETFSEKVVNLLRVKDPQQISLKVRFAEVKRNSSKELGFDFFTGDSKHFSFMSLPNNLITDYDTDDSTLLTNYTAMEGAMGITSGDFFLSLIFDNLEKKGLLRILAEPNLVTVSGEEASFLAGGEFPIPLVDSSSGTNSVHVEFKEYGVKLNFTPIITESGSIRLKVKPETSILDHSAAAVKLGGFSIPALITRKTETTVELCEGESLVIGGLISHTATEANRKVAGLGNIPILGALFTSKSFEQEETELIVLVTPYIVKPITLPGDKEALSEESLEQIFKKQGAPYPDEQADRMKTFLNPSLSEDAPSLDQILKIEEQKRRELKKKRCSMSPDQASCEDPGLEGECIERELIIVPERSEVIKDTESKEDSSLPVNDEHAYAEEDTYVLARLKKIITTIDTALDSHTREGASK